MGMAWFGGSSRRIAVVHSVVVNVTRAPNVRSTERKRWHRK